MRQWILWALLLWAAGAAAQACPASDAKDFSRSSAPQTLHGRLLLHQNLRTWFGLQLEKPVCGQKEIQVIASPDAEGAAAYKKIWKDLETVRGCMVELVSPIDLSPTGYYSTDLYVVASKVKTDANCVRSAPLPDYFQLKPAASIRSYRVFVHLLQTKTPITARVQSAGRELKP